MTRRILLIEDEDDIREIAQVSLESLAGWKAVCAHSGREGLELARRERPDAILLDVMMPDMDGPATLEHLAADPDTRDIPVIFMTAKVQASERRKLSDLGVRGLIAKPFDPIKLAEEISGLLGWGPK
ncbi:MAG: response regulator [Acidobacteriales bacterium]|nr:response regulator [Terriglobales bacterium]